MPLGSKLSDLAPTPQSGRSAPPPRVTFPSRGKSPKARQGLCPLESPDAWSPPSLVLRCACTRATFSHKNRPICHFETVGKLVFFSLQALPESHLQLSIRGTAGLPPRMPQDFLPATNTARVESGGIQGGSTPLCWGSRDQEVPGVSLPTFSTRESRPGFGAERPKGGCRSYQLRKSPRGLGRSAQKVGRRDYVLA